MELGISGFEDTPYTDSDLKRLVFKSKVYCEAYCHTKIIVYRGVI